MNYTALLCFFLWLGCEYQLCAQNAEQHVFASAGDEVTNENVTLSWTLGQSISSASVTSNIYLSEGFQNVDAIMVVSGVPRQHQVVNIYPNPTTDFVAVNTINDQSVGNYRLISLSGKTMLQGFNVDFGVHQRIPMYSCPEGVYTLILEFDNGSVNQYKIIKL